MNTEIKCVCLDILCDVLHTFGNLVASDHEVLLGALLPQLSFNHASVRKKTVSCIGKINKGLFFSRLSARNHRLGYGDRDTGMEAQ